MSQHATVAAHAEKFLAEATRSVRMLSMLLTACDPCGYIRAGGSPNDYTPLAWQVQAALQGGMGASQIKALLQRTWEVHDAARFSEAAVDWWRGSGAAAAAAVA